RAAPADGIQPPASGGHPHPLGAVREILKMPKMWRTRPAPRGDADGIAVVGAAIGYSSAEVRPEAAPNRVSRCSGLPVLDSSPRPPATRLLAADTPALRLHRQ